MKKILLLAVFTILLTGCGTTEKFQCTIEGREAEITLKDGLVSKYILDGVKVTQAEIDEINGGYFTGVASPEQGKEALNNFVKSAGGSCNFD